MPELPEVETVKRDLSPKVTGLKITGLDLTFAGAVRGTSADSLRESLVGRKIVEIGRRAKYLLFRLDDGKTLVIHLKMTGALLWREDNCPGSGPYVRTVIRLDGGCIDFKDQRKFGSLRIVENEAEFLGGLGPEPLEKDFTAVVLGQRLKSHSTPIKAAILDQGVLAGMGNMYADEALFAARIHPLKKANELTPDETGRLHRAIKLVLRKGIEMGGASVSNYVRPDGEKGHSHEQFKVAHKSGGTCSRCGGLLSYVKVRGRGTTFCPTCQRP